MGGRSRPGPWTGTKNGWFRRLEADHYRANPVVQWAHLDQIPAIGRGRRMSATDGTRSPRDGWSSTRATSIPLAGPLASGCGTKCSARGRSVSWFWRSNCPPRRAPRMTRLQSFSGGRSFGVFDLQRSGQSVRAGEGIGTRRRSVPQLNSWRAGFLERSYWERRKSMGSEILTAVKTRLKAMQKIEATGFTDEAKAKAYFEEKELADPRGYRAGRGGGGASQDAETEALKETVRQPARGAEDPGRHPAGVVAAGTSHRLGKAWPRRGRATTRRSRSWRSLRTSRPTTGRTWRRSPGPRAGAGRSEKPPLESRWEIWQRTTSI